MPSWPTKKLGKLKRYIDGAAYGRQDFGPGLLGVETICLQEAKKSVQACTDSKQYQSAVMQI